MRKQQHLSAQCLVERSILLQDDQARRLAEAIRSVYGREELEVRREDWDDQVKQQPEKLWTRTDAQHKQQVLDAIRPWLHDPKYRPEDLERGRFKDIKLNGPEAVTLDQFHAAICAMLFMAVDGTTHSRCEFAIVVVSSSHDSTLWSVLNHLCVIV